MTSAQADLLRRWGAKIGLGLDDSVLARLNQFLALLEVWNHRIRLTGERTTEVLLEKHVPDCLTAAPYIADGSDVVDVGSGAGFPGVVLACAVPAVTVRLVESRRRPASFLREVARTVALPNIAVVEQRWEDWAPPNPGSADVVTGRAVRLDTLLEHSCTVLRPGGVVVGMQSQRPSDAELRALGSARGMKLVETREYVLPSGEGRQLTVFSPA